MTRAGAQHPDYEDAVDKKIPKTWSRMKGGEDQ